MSLMRFSSMRLNGLFQALQFGQPQFGKNGEFNAKDVHDVITGGTFDPPHHGHLSVAEAGQGFVPTGQAMLVMPVGHPGYKPGASSFADRFAMTKLAFSQDVYEVTDFEHQLVQQTGKPSHTVDTMRALYPGFDTLLARTQKRVGLVVGSDLFHPASGIATWGEGVAALLKNILFLVSQRGDEAIPDAIELAGTQHPVSYERVYPLELGLSSTAVRKQVKAGVDYSGLTALTPSSVARYILQNGLYVQVMPENEKK